MLRLRRCTLLVAVCTAMAAVGCGGSDSTVDGSDTGTGDDGGDAGEAGDDAGEAGNDAGDDTLTDSGGGGDAADAPGDGGLDAAPVVNGLPGLALSAGGTVCKSTNYKMIVTLGQSPGGNGTGKSTNYQLRGGVIGASQAP